MLTLVCVHRATDGTTSTAADAAAAEAHKAQADARLPNHELARQMSAQMPPSNTHTHALNQTPDAVKAHASRQASRTREQQAADALPVEAVMARQTFSTTSEAEQTGKRGSAVNHLWGAVLGQQWDLAVPGAPTADGQQAASLNDAAHGAEMLSKTERLPGAEDRQAHKAVLPQVGAERILSTNLH